MADLIEIEELLEKVGIEPIDSYQMTDGNQSYYIFSAANLSGKEEIFLSKLGELNEQINFKEITEDIYFIDRVSFDPNELLAIFEPLYQEEMKELWTDLFEKIWEINKSYQRRNGKCLFKIANDTIRIMLKWDGKLTKNDNDFHTFVNDLNLLIRESCLDENSKRPVHIIEGKYKKHKFWTILSTIRNDSAHTKEHQSPNAVINNEKKLEDAYEELMETSFRTHMTQFDFIKGQKNLLHCCRIFLDQILEDL